MKNGKPTFSMGTESSIYLFEVVNERTTGLCSHRKSWCSTFHDRLFIYAHFCVTFVLSTPNTHVHIRMMTSTPPRPSHLPRFLPRCASFSLGGRCLARRRKRCLSRKGWAFQSWCGRRSYCRVPRWLWLATSRSWR